MHCLRSVCVSFSKYLPIVPLILEFRFSAAGSFREFPVSCNDFPLRFTMTLTMTGVRSNPNIPGKTHAYQDDADLRPREREQAQAQKVGMEVHLLALEVKRRQALFAAGTLAPFQPAPATTVVA
jgi:hypothetical protein